MTASEDAHPIGAAVADMGAPTKQELPQADNAITQEQPEKSHVPGHTHSPAASPTAAADIMTKIFRFFATATPGTLGGVAVGLAATTYLILGQLGLLLIGAFAGIVAFVHWENSNPEVSRAVKSERGVDFLERLLREHTKIRETRILDERNPDEDDRALAAGFNDFQPETREALKELVDAIIRDYVKWWYSPIIPSDRFFPQACQKVLTSFLVSVSCHLARKRPADAFLDFLTNSSSIVIVFFSELSAAFGELPAESKASAADVVYNYLANYPESSLANLVSRRQQAGKFRMVAEDLLGFLERPTYECDPARVFLREILAGVILEMSLQTCSASEWINGWIVYLLEAGEPDFNQAIDVGMQRGTAVENNLIDIDGNVGNVGVSKASRSSFDADKTRRNEVLGHKKKLSKADEQMELAMEEMKRMNQMIVDEEARRSKELDEDGPSNLPAPMPASAEAVSSHDASERLTDALKRNVDELDLPEQDVGMLTADALPQPGGSKMEVSESLTNFAMNHKPMKSPRTPVSNKESSSQSSSPGQDIASQFTSFDQIVPPAQDDLETDTDDSRKPPPLTLHNATITVLDEPGDNRIRTRPGWDYLIQIEPATAHYPGWMIVRKYGDFEPLHEILRRIATISGANAFTEQHKSIPSWKLHTRSSLRGELERYLRDACWYISLAESEGMKKFLEKDQRHLPNPSKTGFQAFEKIGKNVFDVLTSAPVEGSKAVVGGVTGVLGNIGLGQRRNPNAPMQTSSLQDVTAASRLSISTPPRMDSNYSINGTRKRDSIDSQRSSVVSIQPGRTPPMERRLSYNSQGEAEPDSLRPSYSDRWERPPLSGRNSRDNSRASSVAPLRSPSATSLDGLRLPPPPDAMPDDYDGASPLTPQSRQGDSFHTLSARALSRSNTMPNPAKKTNGIPMPKPAKQYSPLSEPETRVAVELVFAIINELYTLSSAWNFRRTLLAAAKSFLLRPGNPSLVSIQTMIQSSVIEANASDAGIAAHLRKLRENTLPTDEERAAWPAELSADERDKLRLKARKLLIESGVPAALSGVMGQSATNEALGRIFDCLQMEEVARGLMFGVMLQAVRTITH